jgi:cation:H+ antiporter
MDIQTLIFFILGLVLLIVGAEALVHGASHLALSLGISPLVVGLTVVAFGTSSPEFAVSISTAIAGSADLAMGNVVGSNIFNVLFILGISAMIVPLAVHSQVIRLDVPIMIGVTVIGMAFALDGTISRFEGIGLFLGLLAYTWFLIRLSRNETNKTASATATTQKSDRSFKSMALNIAFIVVGLVLLVFGSRWLVDGAVMLAKAIGVDDLVIGLTIISAGTSLPEVATSILAAIRKKRDIAVGNVVGSNIFNILGVLGLATIVSPNGITVSSAIIAFDGPVMLAVAVACLPIFISGREIARWEGFVFIVYYIAYTAYLILNATNHATLPLYNSVMLSFVLPITVLTFIIVIAREHRRA